MTYGNLKFRLTQMFPTGIGIDLIEGWIADRYTEILGELPWSRQRAEATLSLVAPYATGTVAVTEGSSAVTLTGGTWPSYFSGRAFRVTGRTEFYSITRATNTTGTLDRPYEGTDAAAAAYSIFQTVYALPSDCRLLEDNAFAPLIRLSRSELNASDPDRQAQGTPQAWASYMDDSSIPPTMQVEIYPVPDKSMAIPFQYVAEADSLTSTSMIVQVWMQPSALIEGVVARIKRHLKDYPGAQLAASAASDALKTMRRAEAHGMGPTHMQLDPYFTSHRSKRWSR